MNFITPIPPSINHAYTNIGRGRRKLTKIAEAWMQSAGVIAKAQKSTQHWKYSNGEKLIMEITVYWPDARRRDTHNLHKLLGDAFEHILYEDDKTLLIRDMDYSIDRKNPRCEIVLYRKETEASNSSE